MKKIIASAFSRMLAFSLLLLVLGACKKNDFAYLLPNGSPILGSISETGTTMFNRAQFSLYIENQGDAPVTEVGICWSTRTMPTLADSKLVMPTNQTYFQNVAVTGLSPSTTYYFRAYATNNKGTGYSEEITVVTPERIVVPCSMTAGYFSIGNTSLSVNAASVYNGLGVGSPYSYTARGSFRYYDYVQVDFNELPVTGKYVTRLDGSTATPKSCVVSSYLYNYGYECMAGDTVYVQKISTSSYQMNMCNVRMNRLGNPTVYRLMANINNN